MVVRRRAGPDVVGRRLAGRDDGLLAVTDDSGDRERLHRVAEEERARVPLEAEVVGDVRLPVTVAVEVDVVPGGR